MAYDHELVERIRQLLAGQAVMTEKKMFGGLTFMVAGHMCCGVLNDDLVVRIGPDRYQSALVHPAARPMDFTGKPLKNMVYIGPEGCKSEEALKSWVAGALNFVLNLPPRRPRTPGGVGKQP